MLKVEELRQSLAFLSSASTTCRKARSKRIIPDYAAAERAHVATYRNPDHPFLQVSWGPVMPANESFQMIERPRGSTVTT